MTITAIKKQVKNPDRYSVFIDTRYSFSLSSEALLGSGLIAGQELTAEELKQQKEQSADDKMYNACLNLIARRMRSKGEIELYLKRKKVSPTLLSNILNKLSEKGLIDDKKFANSFINDRNLLKPTSRRKLILELRSKNVPGDIINEVIEDDDQQEKTNLIRIVENKRRQSKYKDDQKLMQYLARQGFNYSDIKEVLADI
ncbi:MAG: RecX family transcriptional regulator [bacterium]